jgi:hypothetical protein
MSNLAALSSPPTSTAGDERLVLYAADDIRDHCSLKLDSAALVLIALLVGGDYSVCFILSKTFNFSMFFAEWAPGLWAFDGPGSCTCRIWNNACRRDYYL